MKQKISIDDLCDECTAIINNVDYIVEEITIFNKEDSE